jgi:hypothetical protein
MSITNLGLALEFPGFAEINVVLLNTLGILHTGMVRIVSLATHLLEEWGLLEVGGGANQGNTEIWVTVRTTRFRWEAELLQQVLIAHGISARMIDRGIGPYMGQGSAAALQVRAEDEQATSLLLEALDGEIEGFK